MRIRQFLQLLLTIALAHFAQAATWKQIDVPGATTTQAFGINGAGDIVGMYYDSRNHGFLLKNGIFTTIDVPDSVDTVATGINDSGTVVGHFSRGDNFTRGFLFDGQNFTVLDIAPNQDSTSPTAINSAGEVVGYAGCFCPQS